MPITINGSTGISGVDGSAGTPAYQGTDANTGISFPAADTIAFNEGGAEAARIDSSGRLLVGTSTASGSGLLQINGTGQFISIADSAGSNTSTPAEIASGRAKAWVNFNGTGTVAIRASYNVSSITDNGTGDYTVNFTTAMTDANYSAVLSTEHDGGVAINWVLIAGDTAPTSSALRLDCFNTSLARSDPRFITVAVFR